MLDNNGFFALFRSSGVSVDEIKFSIQEDIDNKFLKEIELADAELLNEWDYRFNLTFIPKELNTIESDLVNINTTLNDIESNLNYFVNKSRPKIVKELDISKIKIQHCRPEDIETQYIPLIVKIKG